MHIVIWIQADPLIFLYKFTTMLGTNILLLAACLILQFVRILLNVSLEIVKGFQSYATVLTFIVEGLWL